MILFKFQQWWMMNLVTLCKIVVHMCIIVIPNYISQFFFVLALLFNTTIATIVGQALVFKHTQWTCHYNKKHMCSLRLIIFLANLGPSSINMELFYFYKGHAQRVWKSVMPVNLNMCFDEHFHNCHIFANQCHFFFHNELIWFGPSPIIFEILSFYFFRESVAIILSKVKKIK
jgi:hypothetical protein